MTCPTPATDGQLSSGDPLGGSSCVSYSFAYATCFATGGAVHPTGRQIREWTNDVKGGLELDQCDAAILREEGLNYRTDVFTRREFDALYRTGDYVAVALGAYDPVAPTSRSGQRSFVSRPGRPANHGEALLPGFVVADPLTDGRRAGVWEFDGEPYPEHLVYDFMAALVLSNGRTAGPDHIEASLLRISAAAPAPADEHTLSTTPGMIGYYQLGPNGTAVTHHVAHTNGYSGTCTAPRSFKWHGKRLRLVRMTSGAYSRGQYAGLYLNADAGHVRVRP